MNNETMIDTSDAVAIIGMAGRFPGARDVDEFWNNLKNGTESISVLTDEELTAAGVPPALLSNPHYVRSKGVLRDIADFDASFFGFNPREAEIIDPQHRMFLEASWHALEDAGYDPARTEQRIGLYAGCGTTTYLFHLYNNPEVLQNASGMSVLTSNDKDYLTTRTSYKLNLRGPSVNVQSACSTSLVAIAMASQSLLNYQCDMALAGGVSVRTPEITGFMYQEGGILSPDGHCRTFDAKAHGTVFSSGLGVVLLKRLSDAVADRDHIYAVIRGSAVNNDGQLKIGFTAPSVEGQVEAAAEAIAMAGINPEDISYFEAHGTATQLGDPIEVGALTKVFRAYTDKKGYCAIGSVKTNIGHTDIAAGVAGVIKTAKALKHRTLVPSLHFTAPNPELYLDESPFYVNTQLTEWRRADGKPLLAGVSSFGVGGTNANVILQEAPQPEAAAASRPWQLLLHSARSETALDAMCARMAEFLGCEPDANFADVAYTSKVGRRAFDYRRAIVCRDRAEAVAALEAGADSAITSFANSLEPSPVTFMFSGQGSQYVDMAKGLYQSEAVFREALDRCCEMLLPHLGFDLRKVLYPQDDERAAATETLRQTATTQPALFAIEYAAARLWMSWGIQPESMIGHSVGEYVAACLAGVFSLEDALGLIALRGKLMGALPGGAMLAVMLPEARVLPLLDTRHSVAAVNGPAVTVVSGSFEAMKELEGRLAEANVMFTTLVTSHAFHSVMMEPMLATFTDAVSRVTRHAPQIPYISNVTGQWITEQDLADPEYWSKHLRGTVRFADGFAHLLENESRVFLEVGPGQALQSSGKSASIEAAGRIILGTIRPPKAADEDAVYIARTLATLWANGVTIDWQAYYENEPRYRVPLPGYPFEHERYYVEPVQRSVTSTATTGPLRRKSDLADWFYVPGWKGTPAATLLADNELASSMATWLVFADELGLGDRIAVSLRAQGRSVVVVRPGEEYQKADADSYVVDPQNKDHYARLFKELRGEKREPGRIVHLWNVNTQPAVATLDTIGQVEDQAFFGPLYLAQAVADQTSATRLLLVSNQMQDVLGSGCHSPAKSLLVGPCRLISKECTQVDCRGVDLAVGHAAQIDEALVHQLIAELAVATNDTLVAYRGGMRWVESLEQVRIEAQPRAGQPAWMPLREGGAYLVTGGLGGIGLVVAQQLARTVKAKLVLISRSELPARQEWETWLAQHHHADATSQRIRGLLEVEAAGGEMLVLRADVADLDDMHQVLAEAKSRFGRIDGVFHVAGVPGGGLIPLKTRASAEQVLRPKVRGTLVLDQVFAEESLDFTMLFSSLSSRLAGTGQIDYTSANAFLDSLAIQRRAEGKKVWSIGWDTWSEVGMGVGFDQRTNGIQQQEGRYSPASHGLLQWRHEHAEGETWSSNLDGASHWTLGEHIVVNRPTLVGTAYIDMAVSAARQSAEGKAVELGNIYLLAPLTINEGERKALELQITGNGELRELKFRSRRQSYGEEASWQEHVTGTVRHVSAYELRRVDLAELKRRLPMKPFHIDENVSTAATNIQFGKRWSNLREVGVGKGEVLALLELPPEYAQDLAGHVLHPALLDVATSFAKRYAVEGFFLPISYRRLLVKGDLPQRFYTHVRYADDAQGAAREFITFDISLLDDAGQELVAIEGYSLKRVPEEFLTAAASASTAAATPDSASLEQGMLTAEGVEALRRMLAHDLPTRLILSRWDLPQRIERSQVRNERGVDVSRLAKRSKTLHKRPKIKTQFVAPRNDLEEQVAEVWQGILGIEQIGVDDGFIELGGNSLLAVQVISRLRETFQVELPLEVLYRAPTVGGIAECILATLLESADGDELSKLLVDL
jgi:phthiocerol/phenolphthiocerol synthesis type-I polyketide synthase E